MDSIHKGHRNRLRNKVREFGFSSLSDHEKIEYLLYPFIPRKDTDPIARALIAKFGSFSRVLEADESALMSVKGVSQNAALFLASLTKISENYYKSVACRKKDLENIDEAAKFVAAHIGREKTEHFICVHLDENENIIKYRILTSDEVENVRFDPTKMIADCVQSKAKMVIVGHNHPNGYLVPSDDDISCTNRIAQALRVVGIHLIDHIIVSGDKYFSFLMKGLMVQPVDFLNGNCAKVAEDLLRWKRQVSTTYERQMIEEPRTSPKISKWYS